MPNLPPTDSNDSSDKVKLFFNRYFTDQISFPAEQIDAIVGFFKKRGFDDQAASSTSIVLLQQAKLDDVNPFELLDTLTGLTEVQLSAVVTEVLNYNRQKISTLGYRKPESGDLIEKRNIAV
jgi:hypothetical protein